MTPDDFPGLLDSWLIALAAERKSAKTIKASADGVPGYLAFCDRERIEPVLDHATANAFTASLLDAGAAANTARSRQLAVRQFSAWLADEGLTGRDDLLGLKPPQVDTPNVPSLTDDELLALIKACEGKTFRDRRDEAIVRFAAETTARAEEILAMGVGDVTLSAGMAVIQRGKGGRGRRVPFGPRTGQALDR